MKDYLAKMRGNGQSPPRPSAREIVWSWFGAVLGIALVGYLDSLLVQSTEAVLLIGSFGASAVLLFGAPRSPLAQPRNVIGGHMISALVGVSMRLTLPDPAWACAALTVATAIALMHATGTLHPPGGATALIAAAGGGKIAALGYLFVLIPAGIGAAVLVAVALVVNNLAKARKYPDYWW
jgi:CBS-domain-containing membrane protein